MNDETLREAARLFIDLRNIGAVEGLLGLPKGALSTALLDPEKERIFDEAVQELASKEARRLVAAAVPLAISHLSSTIAEGALEDGRTSVSAAKALIDLWLKTSSQSDEDDELDKLFATVRG